MSGISEVIHSVPSLGESGGGPPRSVSQLCAALAETDHHVSIVTAVDCNDPLVPLSSKIDLVDCKKTRALASCCKLVPDFDATVSHLVSTCSECLIHQHAIWLRASHDTAVATTRAGVPLIVAPRGMLEPWALNHGKWKKKLAWALYQKRDLARATAFHATAMSEAESIRRLGFKQPIAVIPNGVQLPESVVCEGSKVQRCEGREKTAFFLSRLNPKKGLPMLLDAWGRIAPEGWRLVIAGNDDSNHLPVVEQKIRELGLQDQVEIIGPLYGATKEAAYRAADLFVLPSYSENFGIVVAEALGYGVPVLTTTGCPWQELSTHGCGWWVEPTPEGIEAGLNQAIGAKNEDLSAMGARGRALVEQKYQWPAIASQMSIFYSWILHGGPKPDFVV